MKTRRPYHRLAALCALALAPACSKTTDGPVNIGNTQAIGAQLSDYTANWDGYVEAYTFMSGSDRLRVTIAADGSGTVRAGDIDVIAPPTDPNVGYPPGPMDPVPNRLREGFLYPIRAVQVQADRIQFGIDQDEIYAAWCALQTPVLRSSPDAGADAAVYGCLPNLGYIGGSTDCALLEPDGTQQPVDCVKLAMCEGPQICSCTATACSLWQHVAADAGLADYLDEIDGALDSTGNTLVGTLVMGTTRVTIHLQKQ
ncbi:MAG TPA: hypothetical protein VHG72_03345 [Polyangia bacterium]|nr:hypothetical protein [Polyangia bacterium]